MAHLSSLVYSITFCGKSCPGRELSIVKIKSPQRVWILFLLAIIGGLAASACAQVIVDGNLNGSEGYGSPLATQTINTGFGDSTSSNGSSSGGSGLDEIGRE